MTGEPAELALHGADALGADTAPEIRIVELGQRLAAFTGGPLGDGVPVAIAPMPDFVCQIVDSDLIPRLRAHAAR